MSAALLVLALRDPASVARLDAAGWNHLLAAARAERLIGTLAWRLADVAVPDAARAVLDDARHDSAREGQQALWEADRAVDALRGTDVKLVVLKGAAYVAADLRAGRGRFVGDLDILVPRDAIPVVERALIAAGWEWVKEDPYDDAYYRQWMHELPPMIHVERDRMIDVHHTILPLTARPTPDAAAMIADAIPITNGLYILSPQDRIIHSAAHMLADGDMQGGLRNLWDVHCLYQEGLEADADFHLSLLDAAARHQLIDAVRRALRLSHRLYGTVGTVDDPLRWTDRLFIARLLARDGWGRETRKALVFGFFVRSHWLRMPPLMLARHLFTKWRKGHRPQ
ncbi:nucleotidyltransferase domain-containing protein [Sphingobium sp. HWE2-09]|uniref:nucleotidyltransferase domain-containing protein n=1 Tax=Sphingobium sp. HWE2-09 TaxID=3108390 RepID=UPI002DC23AA5|nr:nucleotidyltransferase family protein [Sphingobium sp. HWE2-09]